MEEKDKRIFGLKKNIFFLGLVSLFNDFSNEMIISVLPAFLTVLGAPPIFLGLMDGFADALASFWKIVSGWFSDRIRRRKPIAVSGYALSVSARFFLIFVKNVWQVFAIRMVDRIGKGTREGARDALLAESVSYSEIGKSFGYQRAMDTMGGVLGSLVAIYIFGSSENYRGLFFVSFLIGILAVVSFLFVKEIKGGLEGKPIPHRLSFSIKGFPNYFKVFILAVFIFGLGAMPILLMLLKVEPFGKAYIPVVYFIYNLSFAVFAIPFGKISDLVGKRKVIAGGFLVAIASYFILAAFSDLVSIYVGFILFGMYSAMTDGILRAKASKLVGAEVLAQGEGFLAAALGISSLLAGLIGGGIWTYLGSSAAFTYGGGMMAIGLILFLYWNGFWNRHPDKNII